MTSEVRRVLDAAEALRYNTGNISWMSDADPGDCQRLVREILPLLQELLAAADALRPRRSRLLAEVDAQQEDGWRMLVRQQVQELVAKDALIKMLEEASAQQQVEIERLRGLTKVYGEEAIEGPEGGPHGLITVTGHRGAEQWILTCDEHGELGRWPVVPYTDKTEPELAWERHVAEVDQQP